MKSLIFVFLIFASPVWAKPETRPAKVGEQNIVCKFRAGDLQGFIGKMQLKTWKHLIPYNEQGTKKFVEYRHPVSIVSISNLIDYADQNAACALIMQR